jgi:hypothetical protein
MLAPGTDEERGFGVNLLTPVPIEDSLPPRDVPSQYSPEMLASLDTQCRDFFRSVWPCDPKLPELKPYSFLERQLIHNNVDKVEFTDVVAVKPAVSKRVAGLAFVGSTRDGLTVVQLLEYAKE